MLDTYNHTHRTEHVTNEVTRHVHEHRAPTDETIKLLREMEEKARAKVEKGIRLNDTKIDCFIYGRYEISSWCSHFKIIYKLNGNTHEVSKSIIADIDGTIKTDFLVQEMIRALSEDIAINLLKSGEGLDKAIRAIRNEL
jgi:phosphatidate phosphatase PAH1